VRGRPCSTDRHDAKNEVSGTGGGTRGRTVRREVGADNRFKGNLDGGKLSHFFPVDPCLTPPRRIFDDELPADEHMSPANFFPAADAVSPAQGRNALLVARSRSSAPVCPCPPAAQPGVNAEAEISDSNGVVETNKVSLGVKPDRATLLHHYGKATRASMRPSTPP